METMEHYDHYISRNIKAFYKRKLFSPVVYLILLVLVWNIFSLTDLLFPATFTQTQTLDSIQREDIRYVSAELADLHFTGYTRTFLGNTVGYYYYTMQNEERFFVLLTPDSCEEGLPNIREITVYTKVASGSDTYQQLLDNVAKDLNWTTTGIRSKVSSYYLSEPDFHELGNVFLFGFIFATGLYGLISICLSLAYILNPVLSPAGQDLGLYGNAKELLAQAEEELVTLPQLATEDIFITEHFFILASYYGNAVIPIDQIIWIYKYTGMRKFMWYHFSINYALHICANKHLYLRCPKTVKSDIDGIIDYLSEANHDILVGFSENNRQKAQEFQGTPLNLEKIFNFLKRRI